MKNKSVCVNKSVVYILAAVSLFIALVLLSIRINSQNLSQNSRAAVPNESNLNSYKASTVQVTWTFEEGLVCGGCLMATRTPTLASPGKVLVIKNNRIPQTVLPNDGTIDTAGSYDIYYDYNEVRRIAIEGPTDTNVVFRYGFGWKYCNDPSKNPRSPLGTYWLVRKSDTCPLIADPTPTPELLPDLQAKFTGKFNSLNQSWDLKTTVTNIGTREWSTFYSNSGYAIMSFLYIDPVDSNNNPINPFNQQIAPDTKYQNKSTITLPKGSEFSYTRTMTLSEGSHKLYFWVDPHDWTSEQDESNNEFECITTVQNGKDIVCESMKTGTNIYIPMIQNGRMQTSPTPNRVTQAMPDPTAIMTIPPLP